MISKKTESGDFYGVNINCDKSARRVLLQLTDKDSQTRIMLNSSEVDDLILELRKFQEKMNDKKKGAFYGMAIGDALGAAVEFKPKGTFKEVVGYRGLGPHGLVAGQWTDDTSMALALADSIQHGWSKVDQLSRYVEWMEHGKYSVTGYLFDIGTTTRDSLFKFQTNGSVTNNCEASDSGNGSIMRLAPVPIKYHQLSVLELAEKARESSETTHGSIFAVDSCIYMSIVLAALINGESKETVLSKTFWSNKPKLQLHPVVIEYIFNHEKEPVGSGFVLDSLHAALWAFRTSDSFEEVVLKAVNLGDDSDTTGAVCGQFAGAYWGYSAIPEHLINGLHKKDMIDQYLNPIL